MQNEIRLDSNDLLIMNLVHYFITEKNYNPVILRGVNDEIWLENLDNDYKLIRIVSHYIHNKEQLNFDRFKLFRNINVQGGVKWEAGKPQTEQKYIYLDITRFCTLMCDVAEKYYNSRKTDFSKYHVEIR